MSNLLEYLQHHVEENTRLYIGSRNGFFFIGTAKEALKMLPRITEWYLEYYKNYVDETLPSKIADLKARNKKLQKEVDTGKKENGTKIPLQEIETTKNIIKYNENQIAAYIEQIPKWKRVVVEYKPLLERKILSLFEKITMADEQGTAIKVKGIEDGKYWLYGEWINDRFKYRMSRQIKKGSN